eukprot:3254758-Pyramimonas_sp.AAC.1
MRHRTPSWSLRLPTKRGGPGTAGAGRPSRTRHQGRPIADAPLVGQPAVAGWFSLYQNPQLRRQAAAGTMAGARLSLYRGKGPFRARRRGRGPPPPPLRARSALPRTAAAGPAAPSVAPAWNRTAAGGSSEARASHAWGT